MYEIIKSVIAAGGYKLAEIQHKIKKLYILGDLTEAQTNGLLALAAQGGSPDAERPQTIAMLQSLSSQLEELMARVAKLEGGEEAEPSEYETWKPWDGISDVPRRYGQAVAVHLFRPERVGARYCGRWLLGGIHRGISHAGRV